MSKAMPQEFICVECGQHIVLYGATSEFCLCALCLTVAGWHADPKLRALLGPNLPPLEQPGSKV